MEGEREATFLLFLLFLYFSILALTLLVCHPLMSFHCFRTTWIGLARVFVQFSDQ